jgi:hypothetical protein
MVWFDVPESTLRIELREALTPTATRLRLCTEPRHLQVVAARLRESGVVIAQAGLTAHGNPRAISFQDPVRNYWELYASVIADLPSRSIRRPIGRRWLSLTDSVRAAVRAASAVEARFGQERTSAQNLPRRHDRAPRARFS